MHIVLLRHGTRIDKAKHGISPGQSQVSLMNEDDHENSNVIEENSLDVDPSNWLSNFDPPLNQIIASQEMESAFKKISNQVLSQHMRYNIMIHSSPYNRCIQTSELLLDKLKSRKGQNEAKTTIKLRVDQGLSEWLNESYNLNYLPPNDDGYSMINNVNAYLNMPVNEKDCKGDFSVKSREQLRNVKDPMWSYNQLGHCGEYGESTASFTRRCYNYLIQLLQFYYTRQDLHADKHTVVFIVSHGAIISTLLQILLGRSVFNEIPLCTPIYFKQSEKRRSVFRLMDYDFNLYNLLSPSSDKEFYSILEKPIDLTKLDPENLRSELTIGTSGYATIIQSIPKQLEPPKPISTLPLRRRRNTIGLGEKNALSDDEGNIESLKQTRSSRQLYLLDKDTKKEKVIDLDKLHSYFGGEGGYSDSDSEMEDERRGKEIENIISVNDFEDNGKSLNENIHKGSITSLSSFNEENKSKFQLNMKNFYSKEEPIQSDPYSHFFLNRSESTADSDGFEYDGLCMSRKSSLIPKSANSDSVNNYLIHNFNNKASFTLNSIDDHSSDSDAIPTSEDEDDDERVLSFGTTQKIKRYTEKKEEAKDTLSKLTDTGSGTILNGTYGSLSIGSNLDTLQSTSNTKLNNELVAAQGNGNNIKLGIPTLISTRNLNLHIRGNDTSNTGNHVFEEDENLYLDDKNGNTEADSVRSTLSNRSNTTLKKLLFDTNKTNTTHFFSMSLNDTDDSTDDNDGMDDGWFGGFST